MGKSDNIQCIVKQDWGDNYRKPRNVARHREMKCNVPYPKGLKTARCKANA